MVCILKLKSSCWPIKLCECFTEEWNSGSRCTWAIFTTDRGEKWCVLVKGITDQIQKILMKKILLNYSTFKNLLWFSCFHVLSCSATPYFNYSFGNLCEKDYCKNMPFLLWWGFTFPILNHYLYWGVAPHFVTLKIEECRIHRIPKMMGK